MTNTEIIPWGSPLFLKKMRSIVDGIIGPKSKDPLSIEERLLVEETRDAYKLYQWWDKLNSWEWPKELLPEESVKEYSSTGRRRAFMVLIEYKVSMRAILRFHNRHMTDEQYDDFWKGTHEGDHEAHERYWKYLSEKYDHI